MRTRAHLTISSYKQSCRSGFTLIEALVVLGVAALLAAIALPSLSGMRGRARAAVTLSNIRQMGQGVSVYAASARDLPPAFAEPAWPPGGAWRFEFGDAGGWWFDHSDLYSLEITALLGSTRVARAAGHAEAPAPVSHRGQTASLSDFTLSRTLYASPRFFNWETHRGPEQFGRQALASIAFPADKGLLLCLQYWDAPRYAGKVCCGYEAPLPVCFADLSASEQPPVSMRAGIYNPYVRAYIAPGQDPRLVRGVPVLDTVDGTQGHDRPR